jgi:NAD(P)H-quinone oxidoreductase subunit 5
MMNATDLTAPQALSLLPLALPALHLCAALLGLVTQKISHSVWFASAGLCFAIASGLSAAVFGAQVMTLPFISPAAVSYVLSLLVALLGLVISKFVGNYLAGDSGQARFTVFLHLTLAAVASVAVTNNLFVLLLAWLSLSLAMNELLLFYQTRPRAVLAAHKKFLFARTAELSLLVAFVILYQHHGTAQISTIMAAYPAELGLAEQIAMVLVAFAAIIKCAQLPVHGWLIQVVEAPTPVSALLHAGVVNLGGYLLILFAPLLTSSIPAIAVILFFAGLSTALASLIMTTRVSVKVKLAWSTVAQMGLMLVECALGLFELALLHLLAHACYKAYLFLRSGSAVEQHIAQQLAPAGRGSVAGWSLSFVVAGAITALVALFVAPAGPISPWLLLAAFIAAMLSEYSSVNRNRPSLIAVAFAGLLMLAYLLQKELLTGIAPTDAVLTVSWLADLWVLAMVSLLIGGWLLLRYAPEQSFTRKLRNWLFAGFFLDEWMTRTTLRLWPLRIPIRIAARTKNATALEVK